MIALTRVGVDFALALEGTVGKPQQLLYELVELLRRS